MKLVLRMLPAGETAAPEGNLTAREYCLFGRSLGSLNLTLVIPFNRRTVTRNSVKEKRGAKPDTESNSKTAVASDKRS
jgi:hypothetical protein